MPWKEGGRRRGRPVTGAQEGTLLFRCHKLERGDPRVRNFKTQYYRCHPPSSRLPLPSNGLRVKNGCRIFLQRTTTGPEVLAGRTPPAPILVSPGQQTGGGREDKYGELPRLRKKPVPTSSRFVVATGGPRV